MADKSVLALLQAPFSQREIKHRIGRTLPDGSSAVLFLYVDARACQDRLDEVFGVDGWNSDFRIVSLDDGAVVFCELSVSIDGNIIKRVDCSELVKIDDAKAAASTAFKRACAALGIGRYIYNVGEIKVRLDGRFFNGDVLLPDSLLPADERQGRQSIEIVYHSPERSLSNPTPRTSVDSYPPELEDAMNFVVETGFFKGRPMKDVTIKGLGWIKFNSKSQPEIDAANSVFKFISKKQPSISDEQDIPF